MYLAINPIVNSIVYSFLGIAILVIAFIIVEVITPKHNLWKEVVEKQNMALALVAGFFMLSIAIIIASAIH
jgi:putative membrane protein